MCIIDLLGLLVLIFIAYCEKDHLFAEHHEFFGKLACLLTRTRSCFIRMDIFLAQQLLLLHLHLYFIQFYSKLYSILYSKWHLILTLMLALRSMLQIMLNYMLMRRMFTSSRMLNDQKTHLWPISQSRRSL